MIDFEIGFVVGVCMTVAIYCGYRAWVSWQTEPIEQVPADRIDTMAGWSPNPTDLTGNWPPTPSAKELKKIEQSFAVSGKPARVPWHIRRRELAEAAKTKRKKLESFQEID